MRAIENGFWLFWSLAIITILWGYAEVLIYGEVQSCDADSFAAYLFCAVIVLAYKRGWKHGKEDAHGQN